MSDDDSKSPSELPEIGAKTLARPEQKLPDLVPAFEAVEMLRRHYPGSKATKDMLVDRMSDGQVRAYALRTWTAQGLGPTKAWKAGVPPDAAHKARISPEVLGKALHLHLDKERWDWVKGNCDIDPLFKSLLKHHWMEEAQHAKLDTLMVEALAEGRSEAEIQGALDEYLEIGMFLDEGLKAQTGLNLDAFEKATGRKLGEDERAALAEQQHQALRWTYLGSGMTHPKFVATLAAISPAARDRIAKVAPAFC